MSSCYGQIESAGTVDAVVAIVRDHLATWSPGEIAMLPPAVRPGRVRDESDIAYLHDRLVEEDRATRATGEELASLQRLVGLFVRASLRIAALGGPGEGGDAGAARPSSLGSVDA